MKKFTLAIVATVCELAAAPRVSAQAVAAEAAPVVRVNIDVRGAEAARRDGAPPTVLCGQPLEISVFVVNAIGQAGYAAWLEGLNQIRAANATRSPSERSPEPEPFKLPESDRVSLRVSGNGWWDGIELSVLRLQSPELASGSGDAIWVEWIDKSRFQAGILDAAAQAPAASWLGVDPVEGTVLLDPTVTAALPEGTYRVRCAATKSRIVANAGGSVGQGGVLTCSADFVVLKPATTAQIVEADFRSGQYFMAHREYAQAISAYEQVIGLDASYLGHLPLALLGESKEGNGDKVGALTAYLKFVAALPPGVSGDAVLKVKGRIASLQAEGIVPQGSEPGAGH